MLSSALRRVLGALLFLVFLYLGYLCVTEATPYWLYDRLILKRTLQILLALLGVYILARLASLLPKRAREISVRGLFLLAGAAYLAAQVYFAMQLYSSRGTAWDFNIVAGAAMDYCTDGTLGGEYFRMWPNNTPIFLLLVAVMKPFALMGVSDLNFVGIGLNILAIDLSVLLCYLTLRRLFGGRLAAGLGALLMLATPALLIYVPIYYTDTLTMPFPILPFYLWLRARERLQDEGLRPALPLLAAMGAVAAAGMALKITAGFMLIAVAIDAALCLPVKKLLGALGAMLGVFLALYLPMQLFFYNNPLLVEDDPSYYIPKTHWIMMGLTGNGNYYDPDYKYTLSFPPEQRDEAVAQEIGRRLREMGVSGLLQHLRVKCAFTWGEGSYYSAYKIDRLRARPSVMDSYIIYSGYNYYILAHWQQGLMLINILSVAAACLAAALRRQSPRLLPCLIAIFGLFLFLCLWETRSRYLFNHLPVFITVTASALCLGFSRLEGLLRRAAAAGRAAISRKGAAGGE